MERGQEFFDREAPEWDKKRNTDPDKLKFLLSLAELPNRGKILDVGCGTGLLTEYILQFAGNGTLTLEDVDYSAGMIAVAKAKFSGRENVRFICADIRQLNLQSQEYDFIISLNFFPHLTSLTDKKNYLRKGYEALKPGGKLVIMHDISREKVNGIHEHKPETFNDKLPSAHDTGVLLIQAGFKEVVGIEDDYIFFVRGCKYK